VKKLHHQARTGLTARYTNQRVKIMHHHEVAIGDPRLFQWVMGFKPWLQSGVPTKFDTARSFRRHMGVAL